MGGRLGENPREEKQVPRCARDDSLFLLADLKFVHY